MTAFDDPRILQLAQVASLYYDQNKSQQEIADEVGISRSAISRLLTEAKEKGIVEIVVHYPWRTVPSLETELAQQFNLKSVKVLERANKSYQEMLQGLGVLAAQHFSSLLHDGIVVGISWGTALYQMIKSIRRMKLSGVEVIQLIGATGNENNPTDGPILAQLLSQQLGGTSRYLHAPLVVDTESAREALMQNRNIRKTIDRMKAIDIALVGIGSTKSELYSLLRAGYVTEDEAQQIRMHGAVGDVCAQHYKLDGEWLDIDINRRILGISLEALQNIDVVIGVAGGSQKGAAILGALRGKYINTLITDDQAAQKVLALSHSLDNH